MKKRYLGKNKLEVSSIGLGCMGFTQSYPPYLPENEAIFVLQQAVDLGINFFDTADHHHTAAEFHPAAERQVSRLLL